MNRLIISSLVLCLFIIKCINGDDDSKSCDRLGNEEPFQSLLAPTDFGKRTGSTGANGVNGVKYIGAVLEYEPYNRWTEDAKGYGIQIKNAETIVTYAKKAKLLNADIIIGPEYGIPSLDLHKDNIENFLTFTQYVPDPSLKIVPCNFDRAQTSRLEALRILSCGAKESEIYIVVALSEISSCSDKLKDQPWTYETNDNCPDEGYLIFNTQVVFDRTGAVIARYRKQHLFLEDLYTPGLPNNEEALFITDFDVAFSLQICFDIIYETPAYDNVKNYGIRDVAMSTAWIDELPYYLENGFHNAWSKRLGVNLLVSGFHEPDKGHLGSGIFKGYSQELPNYSYNETSGNVLLVSVIETVSASSLSLPINNIKKGEYMFTNLEKSDYNIPLNTGDSLSRENRIHELSHQNLSEYTAVLLKRGLSGQIMNNTICNKGFCCDISYEYSGNQTYYILAFSGAVPAGNGEYHLGSQICDLVWCQDSDYSTCAKIESRPQTSDSFEFLKISSKDFKIDSVYPVANHRNKSLINNNKIDFENNGSYSAMSIKEPIKNLLTFALNGRWYSMDS